MGAEGGGGGKAVGVALRLLAMLLTLAAAVVLGLDKENKTIAAPLGAITLEVPVSAKSSYLPAFMFFVAANAIACGFAVLSILFLLANKGRTAGRLALLTVLGDMVMVALLFSGAGAAIAIGLTGKKGNKHLQWGKVCNIFVKFCNLVEVAFALSLLGSVVYLLLVGIAIFRLHKRINYN